MAKSKKQEFEAAQEEVANFDYLINAIKAEGYEGTDLYKKSLPELVVLLQKIQNEKTASLVAQAVEKAKTDMLDSISTINKQPTNTINEYVNPADHRIFNQSKNAVLPDYEARKIRMNDEAYAFMKLGEATAENTWIDNDGISCCKVRTPTHTVRDYDPITGEHRFISVADKMKLNTKLYRIVYKLQDDNRKDLGCAIYTIANSSNDINTVALPFNNPDVSSNPGMVDDGTKGWHVRRSLLPNLLSRKFRKPDPRKVQNGKGMSKLGVGESFDKDSMSTYNLYSIDILKPLTEEQLAKLRIQQQRLYTAADFIEN